MKCKKMMLLASVIGGLTLSSLSHAELSDSLIINYSGAFQGTTCSISTSSANGVGDGMIDIYLGAYATNALKTAGDTTSAYVIPLEFKDCGEIKTVSITFNGDQTTPTIFDVSGVNQGIVGLGLSESEASTDYIASGDPRTLALNNDGSGTYTYFARFVKIGDEPVKDGLANAITQLDITYR